MGKPLPSALAVRATHSVVSPNAGSTQTILAVPMRSALGVSHCGVVKSRSQYRPNTVRDSPSETTISVTPG